jgi:nickel/cobalt transporter (NicO) family protein
MWQIFIGSLLLSLIHASIPNHWIPLLAIGKAEKWKLKEMLAATAITGFAHTLSTILIGVVVGLIGIELSNSYSLIMSKVAPSILLVIGIVYVILDLRHHKHHHHYHEAGHQKKNNNRSKLAILFSLSLAMFLTPCIEIEAYYFQAGLVGWKGIFMVSAVYTITTVTLMLLLVTLGYKGTQRMRSHFLEHHERLITGSVLIILGLIAFFVEM